MNIFHNLNDVLAKRLFLVSLLIVIGLNFPPLSKETKKIVRIKKHLGYQFLGTKFIGLEGLFKDVDIVGYYTDKDLDQTTDAMQFSQAQYVLAPTLLDLNNTEHEYILFDCRSDLTAFMKMKEIKTVPLMKNQFGIILAQRK